MPELKDIFLKKSQIAFDRKHRQTIVYNISKYNESVYRGKQRFLNWELAKQRASYIKSKTLANLDRYLEEFEKNAIRNGIEVIWARNGEEAVQEIISILKQNDVRLVVKSKSMISEEVDLNAQLVKNGIEAVETDLGEFIVQTAGEKPYHILTPAMHKSKGDVGRLFNEKFGTPLNATPEELTAFVRKKLRKKFTTAEAGITGANFLVADAGGVALTENEGNGCMSIAFPKIHIVISGIEKVIPSFRHLPLYWPLLSAAGTGQQVTVYNSLLTGPQKENESGGPEKMFVILLDNKRSDIARETELSQSLKCIRCGACLNACPIYKNIGGYTYNTTYSGPIGSVITPFFKGFKSYGHLSFACTVCGACTEVCPVKIPLHQLLLLNRKKYVEQNNDSLLWRLGMKAYLYAFKKRQNMDAVNGNIKNKFMKVNRNLLGNQKVFPSFTEKSFAERRKLN